MATGIGKISREQIVRFNPKWMIPFRLTVVVFVEKLCYADCIFVTVSTLKGEKTAILHTLYNRSPDNKVTDVVEPRNHVLTVTEDYFNKGTEYVVL